MNRNIKKFFALVCICLVLVLSYKIIQTYALFQSEMFGTVELNNATWKIKVNKTEITKGIEESFVIEEINTTQNENVKPGKIAPGISGSFEIEIDPTDTDVSIQYEIILDESRFDGSNLKIKSVEEILENNVLNKVDTYKYCGIIPLEDIKLGIKNLIKVELEWENNEDYNDGDTKLGLQGSSKIGIPIQVRVSQYLDNR